MSRTIGARAWVGFLTLLARLATGVAGLPVPAPAYFHTWVILVVLGVCGAATHMFPIRSALGGATFTLTNIILVSGAVILPPAFLTPLAILALTPERWLRRGHPGLAIGWFFNVSQSVLALHVAAAWVHWAGAPRLTSWTDLGVLLVAAALFTIVQDLLVGVIISISTGASLSSSEMFSLPALLGDSLLALMGVLLAGLWLTSPFLLPLLPPVLIILFRMTRTAHLAHLAELDVKTGLYNARRFQTALEHELARSQRLGRPLSVLFADLDHLKQINDRFGHDVGDRVFVQTADLFTSALRRTDLVARFGGDEFVALLPGTDGDEAVQLGERVRQAIDEHQFTYGDSLSLRCTVSIGVASFPDDASDSILLVKQADLGVYRAKQTRNAVVRAGTDATNDGAHQRHDHPSSALVTRLASGPDLAA